MEDKMVISGAPTSVKRLRCATFDPPAASYLSADIFSVAFSDMNHAFSAREIPYSVGVC